MWNCIYSERGKLKPLVLSYKSIRKILSQRIRWKCAGIRRKLSKFRKDLIGKMYWNILFSRKYNSFSLVLNVLVIQLLWGETKIESLCWDDTFKIKWHTLIEFQMYQFLQRGWPSTVHAKRFSVSSKSRNVFMGPTWGPSGAERTQVGPMLTPWILLSGLSLMLFSASFTYR